MLDKNKFKRVHISISEAFYNSFNKERIRTQNRLKLQRELSFPEFSEMYIKGCNKIPPFRINNFKRGINVKPKKR
jgi:hypothetical protein